MLNGPFSAAYAGNSIGSVIAFVTRMPSSLEVHAEVQGAVQSFAKYGDDKDYSTARFAGSLGDRLGPFAFRLSYSHLDDHAQPLTYTTTTARFGDQRPLNSGHRQPSTTPTAPASRSWSWGRTASKHQVQDNVSGRFTWDLTPTVTAAYTFGLFVNNDDVLTVNSYLRDAAGNPAPCRLPNIAGRTYLVAASASPMAFIT